jgi:hypothetical protein
VEILSSDNIFELMPMSLIITEFFHPENECHLYTCGYEY